MLVPELVQVILALVVLVVLLISYRKFLWPAYRFVIHRPGLTLILTAVYALAYAQLGTSKGVHLLFWHEKFLVRLEASLGLTLLLALIGVLAYYLDPDPEATARVSSESLRADETLRLGGRPPRFKPSPDWKPVDRITLWDRVRYAAGLLFDPTILIPPLARNLEAGTRNTWRLQHFLRVGRTPFLIPLLAPALLPGMFSSVPRVAPTADLQGVIPGIEQVRAVDSLAGYGLSVLAWWLGIVCGVLLVKVLIRLSEMGHWLMVLLPVGFFGLLLGGGMVSSVGLWLFLALAILLGALDFFVLRGPRVGREKEPRPAQETTCPPVCRRGGKCVDPRTKAPTHCSRGIHWDDFEWNFRSLLASVARRWRCRDWRNLFRSLLMFLIVVFGVYLALGNVTWLYVRIPPAFAICAVLGLYAMLFGLLGFFSRVVRWPIVLGLLAWLAFVNHDAYKVRFEGLDNFYEKPVPLRERIDSLYFRRVDEPAANLVPDEAALIAWKDRQVQLKDRNRKADDWVGEKPKLVLVAVSGGATRSAYWTATVLNRLEGEIPAFGQRVRILSGASGGMLGAGYYVLHRRNEALGSTDPDWLGRVPVTSLNPLARYIALWETLQAFSPGRNGSDRGIELEKDWNDLRETPFSKLVEDERAGSIPSIIFSPMMIEDGRQLLISNLDLGFDTAGSVQPLVKTYGNLIGSSGFREGDYSLSGVEFFRLFPGTQSTFTLSTAVRMSASFPYVSPAVNLPTDPPRRVVDAGYYDNYGIQVATQWILQNRRWLAENTGGVLLVQVRDSLSVRDRLDVADELPPPWTWAWLLQGFQFAVSPIEGFNKARYTTTAFRSDKAVAELGTIFAMMPEVQEALEMPESFFNTVVFENTAEVSLYPPDPGAWPGENLLTGKAPLVEDTGSAEISMTWYLTGTERDAMSRAIPTPQDGSDWLKAEKRKDHLEQLKARIAEVETKLADRDQQLLDQEKIELRRQRDALSKALEQARNYERLVNLKDWWSRGVRAKPVPPPTAP